MGHTPIETLIVGQGLAGSALAWHLIAAGQRVLVIDDGHRTSSSRVAAGLVNPLAGMRFNRRPELDDWLAAADRWYHELAVTLGHAFFHPLPMLRLFRSAQQRRFYERRAADPASRSLLGAACAAEACPEPVAAPFGGFLQHRTGYVDLPLLLDRLRDWLDRQQALHTAVLKYRDVRVADSGVEVGGLAARRVVFCDGARLRDNPWFRTLPLAPDKGEILNIEVPDWEPGHIVNAAHWLVPLGNHRIRLGATHEHHRLGDGPTDEGRRELLAGWRTLRPHHPSPRVTAHQAGIRPGTRDRYPLVGPHPEYSGLWVFNGFGARGTLTVPWYAMCLARHLCLGTALPAEADIRRFACAPAR